MSCARSLYFLATHLAIKLPVIHPIPLPAHFRPGSKARISSKLNLKLGPAGMAKNLATDKNLPKF